MSYLLDTHTFLWYVDNDDKLGDEVKNIISNPNNSIFLSIVSVWEMAIKVSIKKLEVPLPIAGFIREQLGINDITLLNIRVEHMDEVVELPFHHRDPFDRLIIAQAITEKMPIIGYDRAFEDYDVTLIG